MPAFDDGEFGGKALAVVLPERIDALDPHRALVFLALEPVFRNSDTAADSKENKVGGAGRDRTDE